jgi:glycine C-acetyltransferase
MAAIGAFVAGDKQVIQYLRYTMRSQIFAKTLPIAFVIGALKRLELLRQEPELRENLWKITKALQNGLTEQGFNIGTTTTPVTPIFFAGGAGEAANMAMDIRETFNIFCSVVIYPVVPKDVIIFRLIPTAAHTLSEVEETIEGFSKAKENLRNGFYKREELINISGR